MTRQTPTDEQSLVITCKSDRVRVDAGAGTGKTFALSRYASVRPHLRGVYLAFNKSVQIDACRKFPTSCRALTLNSLAFGSHGRVYKDAGKLVPSIRHSSLLHLIADADIKRRFLRARLGLLAVHEYTVSDLFDLAPSPRVCAEALRLAISPDQVNADAAVIWRAMCDLSNPAIGISHDGYFKLWALTQPKTLAEHFEYVLVDEAQDLNPVANAVLQAQNSPLVYVGDSAQSIYAFRGATDCLDSFEAEETLQLTRSFRFGSSIASLANSLLATYKEKPLTLVGLAEADLIGPVQTDLPYAVIARTNAGAFAAAATAVNQGSSIHFVGGPAAYGFGRIKQVQHLVAGELNKVTDPFLRIMGSLESLREYAELVKDGELKSICRVVEEHGATIPHLLEMFEQHSVQTPSQESGAIEAVYKADVFISTGHRAKGLEFMQVKVADDFPSLMRKGKLIPKAEVDIQEIHLLYVALTRAAMLLEPPEFMKSLLPPVKRVKKQESVAVEPTSTKGRAVETPQPRRTEMESSLFNF